jgi:hypothetical protein
MRIGAKLMSFARGTAKEQHMHVSMQILRLAPRNATDGASSTASID